MRFGVCAGAEKAEVLARIGYDFIELSVAGDLMVYEDEAAWQPAAARLNALALPVESFNSFVRVGKVVGPDVDYNTLYHYVYTALERAAEIGGQIVVFGSGGARTVPDGFMPDEASEQLLAFLNLCADASDEMGVIVVIEPLQKAESNIINRVSEAALLVRHIARKGVQALGDTFHMEREDEPLSALIDARDVLAHVHVADTGRRAPATGTYDYMALFRALREAGYDGRVAIECSWGEDFEGEAARALHALQAAYHAVEGEARGSA